jgi:hypothetical protein
MRACAETCRRCAESVAQWPAMRPDEAHAVRGVDPQTVHVACLDFI